VIGQKAPSLVLPDLAGTSTTLVSLAGKVVLIDFWASWCAPCRNELPRLEALQAEHGSELVVLAINVDERTRDRDRYLARSPLALTVLDDSKQQVVAAYAIEKMPTSVLIDRAGVVQAVHYGYTAEGFEELQKAVADLL